MILVELLIQDFKQFAGEHRFTPTSEGVVAVIGQNGAGKTTLFEAIEWCLYQPREIGAEEVFPRGRAGRPKVQLTLLDPATGISYVIARWLNKSRTADAEIYRLDMLDSRIVKGSRPVIDHVTRTLIGLSHRAFVSTFFTRQKELTFFGDLKETDRRREVGKLLGMETIRDAQKSIADERADRQARAKAFDLQYRESSRDRDFEAEIATALTAIDEQSTVLASTSEALAAAESRHAVARAELERVAVLERAAAELRTQLERTAGEINTAEARRASAQDQLTRIDQRALQRGDLEAAAARIGRARDEVRSFEAQRERFVAARRLDDELARARRMTAEAVADLRRSVEQAPIDSLPDWRWTRSGEHTPLTAVEQLIGVAGAIEPDLAAHRVRAMERAATLSQEHARLTADLARYQDAIAKLVADRATLADSRPVERLAEIKIERDDTQHRVAAATARDRAIQSELADLEPALAKLTAPSTLKTCPTCGQMLAGPELAVALRTMKEKSESLREELVALRSTARTLNARLVELDQTAGEMSATITRLTTLSERIANGESKVADTESAAREKTDQLSALLATLSLPAPPLEPAIELARRESALLAKAHGSLPLLHRLRQTLRQSAADEQRCAAELAALGDSAYDPAAHEIARQLLANAERANVELTELLKLLASRSEHEAVAAAAQSQISGFLAVQADLRTERAALGFDPDFLEQARATELAALTTERTARDRRSAAELRLAEVSKTHANLVEEHRQIERLLERAAAASREADELDLMYREFNAFEQFVADRLTPQLSDYTSELLDAITEGKYDQVQFNSNYGIEVFDGHLEKFPVDEFSGGERDVIALCARLALSRLIGNQANNPPGFMVLDEVFGSLDANRRVQVLEKLGSLAGTEQAFHQLFIISHVDDVRSSPIFNEVWRVSEGPDGVSYLENLNITGGFDDA